MANQQAYQAYVQNKGTLVTGQTISVNKFNVQVERYLSQGGFAHVYLVRTATPVYNTTHHVLKRIAVANDAMLTEVKKEVDIMRLLKGHPNIVHLIDAAWHRMPDGLYEVFILMEFCPGGGIIDMMNRRLRERLTEAEILQIFVDVCEGVAYMHNSRPPLLHRDLKVENILQSTPTSFKLCDFGSATTVAPRPPATTQEIRALEADLNRHTTLQYRAPEMVDPYLRRPVDEKSDVWALGVLLYKLCYYTTPFEEHGPLAILNVQYRIPPYPVYSTQMNALIGSMLRDHGTQRPSVFELLSLVHRLRGTKSPFQYTIPAPQPLSPRHSQIKSSSQSVPSPANPVDNVISYRSAQQATPSSRPPIAIRSSDTSPSKNLGVQAREMVLEAIAPMRRGRPTLPKDSESKSRHTSPKKEDLLVLGPGKGKEQNWLDGGFDTEEEKAWQAVSTKEVAMKAKGGLDDAWNVDKGREGGRKEKVPGFGDNFSEKPWDSFNPSTITNTTPNSSNSPSSATVKATITPFRPPAFTGTDAPRINKQLISRAKDKDAFEGLGLGPSANDRPAPTLGEARKLRTGLAATNTNTNVNGYSRYDSSRSSPRPTPSPRPPYLSPSQSQQQSLSSAPPSVNPSASGSPALGGSPWRSSQPSSRPNSTARLDGLPVETRFPSLEELDATFGSPEPGHGHTANANASRRPGSHLSNQPQLVTDQPPQLPSRNNNIGSSGTGGLLRPIAQPQGSYGYDGIRSEQVTGVAMRESRKGGTNTTTGGGAGVPDLNRRTERERGNVTANGDVDNAPKSKRTESSALESRPALLRKHRSSISIKHAAYPNTSEDLPPPSRVSHPSEPSTDSLESATRANPSTSLLSTRQAPTDWLTGDDDDHNPHATSASASSSELPVLRESPSKRASFIQRSSVPIQEAIMAQHGHAPLSQPHPELPVKSTTTANPPSVARTTRVSPPVNISTAAIAPQRSTEALTENWSPVATTTSVESSSSADEGPEDVSGYTPRPTKITEDSKRIKRKGRQSSVHDLVDLWGGGLSAGPKEKEREKEPARMSVGASHDDIQAAAKTPKRRSTILPSLSATPNTVSPSPRSMLSPPPDPRPPSRRPTTDSGRHNNRPSSGGLSPSPSSTRSRPQSMFIYPSKSNSESSPLSSAGLSPPEQPKSRSTRRTSISDMVQRYEAIGGKVKVPGLGSGLASDNLKPTGLKVATHTTDSDHYPRGQGSSPATSRGGNVNDRAESSVPASDESPTEYGVPPKNRRSPTGFPRTSPGLPRTSPIGVAPRSPTSQRETGRGKEPDGSTLSPQGTSSRLDDTSVFAFPSRKTTSIGDSSSRSGDGRSPSPERPYQGVGKLIDQWQRKTAESDASRNPVVGRRGLVKRAGLVNAGLGRGQ